MCSNMAGIGLTLKYKTMLERCTMYKRSSLFCLSVGDEEKRFVSLTAFVNVIQLFSSSLNEWAK